MTDIHRTAVLDAVKRASRRSAQDVQRDIRRGVDSLLGIIATAPFIGILGTALGILNCFQGFDGPRSAAIAAVMTGLSESLVPFELGLLAALIAFCSHMYLLSKLEGFEVEMQNASLQLINQLGSTNFRATTLD